MLWQMSRVMTRRQQKETDQQARFERLWEEQRPRIWRLVARLAGSVDVADDLTQEVGLRAFQGFAEFRGEARASTWLYRIAVNVVHRHRERQKETVLLDTPEVAALPDNRANGPEETALQNELLPAVRAALERLPDPLRAPLILHVYEGLKYREIAAILEIPVGTVMSRLHTARKNLREELKDYAL